MKRFSLAVVTLFVIGCDAPKAPTPVTAAQEAPVVPFEIVPQLWGSAEATATYEIRQLPDGSPGLFAADGALLIHLLPELILDVGAAGKGRPKPTTRRFDIVKMAPNPEGGFTLFATLTDDNGVYDLRVESGPRDPRIHVGLTTRWARDVRLEREILRFATGPFESARAVGHDAEWTDVGEEWIGPAHAPSVAQFGRQVTVAGRFGTENLVVRQDNDRWQVEIEAFHHQNHPIDVGERCDTVALGGAADFAAGTRAELRADIVIGELSMPLVLNFPQGRRAAISLNDVKDGGARSFVAPMADASPSIVERQGAWLGASVEELPCAEGRSATLAQAGVVAMWSGGTMVSSGANLLAPTETDGRRVFAFRHPGTVPTLFALSDGEPDRGWFAPAAIARLKGERGLIVARTPLDEFLSKDADEAQSVQESLTEAARDGAVWLAPIDEIASRLTAIDQVDLDLLPAGVVRIRNLSTTNLEGVTLLLPEGTSAKYPTGTVNTSSARTSWVNVSAGRDQLFQLMRGDVPAWTITGIDITVSYDSSAQAP